MFFECLIFTVLSVINATGLYVIKGDSTIPIRFPGVESLTPELMAETFRDNQLVFPDDVPNLHFDKAKTLDIPTIMSLPSEFFQTVMTVDQLKEIVLNDELKSCLVKSLPMKLMSALKDQTLMKNKLQIIRRRLGELSAANLGENLDVFISKLDKSNYKHISPFMAFASKAFKFTVTNIARVLRFSLKMIIAAGKLIVPEALKQIKALAANPARIFMILQVLLNMIGVDTTLIKYLGEGVERIIRLKDEVNSVTNGLVDKANEVIPNLPVNSLMEKDGSGIDLPLLPTINLMIKLPEEDSTIDKITEINTRQNSITSVKPLPKGTWSDQRSRQRRSLSSKQSTDRSPTRRSSKHHDRQRSNKRNSSGRRSISSRKASSRNRSVDRKKDGKRDSDKPRKGRLTDVWLG